MPAGRRTKTAKATRARSSEVVWYDWQLTEPHATRRVARENGDERLVCRCGYKSHWSATHDPLSRAAERHANRVA